MLDLVHQRIAVFLYRRFEEALKSDAVTGENYRIIFGNQHILVATALKKIDTAAEMLTIVRHSFPCSLEKPHYTLRIKRLSFAIPEKPAHEVKKLLADFTNH